MPSVRLDSTLLCPLSGCRFGELTFKPHRLTIWRTTKNGTLWCKCEFHGIRVFVFGRKVVAAILKRSRVLLEGRGENGPPSEQEVESIAATGVGAEVRARRARRYAPRSGAGGGDANAGIRQ